MFFALTKEEEAALLSARDTEEVLDAILEIEERWDEPWLRQMDKSWDAIHRCLGDGSLDTKQPALTAKAVLGGRHLSDRDDEIVSFLPCADVQAVSAALALIDQAEFRRRYFGLARNSGYEGEIGDEDYDYTWSYFDDMRSLFTEAAAAGRSVVFSVDQ